jgi:IclR family mhp operon transcriptional activator
VYLSRALSEEEAIKRFVAPLQDIANRVQEGMVAPAPARRVT